MHIAPDIGKTALAASCVVLAYLLGPSVAMAATPDCDELSRMSFGSRARVISAGPVNGSSNDELTWLPAPFRDSVRSLPAFCRVVVVSTPSAQSSIGVEIWLPLTGWNGRYLGTGNGGYPLSIFYPSLIEGLQKGFAVSNTDMGLAAHKAELSGSPGDELTLASASDATKLFIGHPVRLLDFGSRATHEMTVVAKLVTARFYNKPAARSYFAGCSTGGMQALQEAAQYPDDYNGVVAGDPGENRARLHLSLLWNFLTVWHQPERTLSSVQLAAIHSAVISACGGESHDPYLKAPLTCAWKPESLVCGAGGGICLTQAQVQTVNLIYQGPRNPRTGEQYYPGLAHGSELGWGLYTKDAATEPLFKGLFAFGLGEDFKFEAFDWDRDAETFIDTTGPFIDVNPDLTEFGRRGGKLLLYTGGSDYLTSPADPTNFYRKAGNQEARGGRMAINSYALLYVLPGMDHCLGGLGPDRFDQMSAITRWTEEGTAPMPLTIWKSDASGTVTNKRRICPYIPEASRSISQKKLSPQACHED